jgi:hypothetical protein
VHIYIPNFPFHSPCPPEWIHQTTKNLCYIHNIYIYPLKWPLLTTQLWSHRIRSIYHIISRKKIIKYIYIYSRYQYIEELHSPLRHTAFPWEPSHNSSNLDYPTTNFCIYTISESDRNMFITKIYTYFSIQSAYRTPLMVMYCMQSVQHQNQR